MKLIALLAAPMVLLMGQSDQPVPHSVVAVRHWSLGQVTRIAVELTSPFQYTTDRLHNPERVFYDIPNTHLHIENKRTYAETINDKLLQRIRVAETVPGVTRVVLDLNPGVEATASTLSNPYRLMIELSNPGAPVTDAPATAAAQRPVPKLPASPPLTGKNPPIQASTLKAEPDSPAVTAEPSKVQQAPEVAASRPPAVLPEYVPSRPAPVVPEPTAPVRNAAPSREELAKGAKPTSGGNNSLTRTLGLKINRVVIDPGHGGHDQGTEGPKGLLEKDLVLDVALRLGKLVQDKMGAEVIYTRSDDTFISLEGRTALANEKKADLFLSIHANSSPVARIAGVETFFLNVTGSKDALDVAARENGASHASVNDLPELLEKIVKQDKAEESREFARRIQASLYSFSNKNFPTAKDRGVKSAPFIVLIGAKMPSVLAEIGFVSNSREELLLNKPEYRQKVAEALFKGMEKYTDGLSHFQAAARP